MRDESSAASGRTVTVTIKGDTRHFRRALIEAELGMPRRFRPSLLRRLRLRWRLWKVKREAAP